MEAVGDGFEEVGEDIARRRHKFPGASRIGAAEGIDGDGFAEARITFHRHQVMDRERVLRSKTAG